MGLENANYIRELVDTNPVTATDPVLQGSDHLRMLKRVLQNQFVNFEGETPTPKAVTLTEDQINDAALKDADNTFNGSNTFAGANTFNLETNFNQQLRLANNIPIVGRNAADSAWASLLQIGSDDNVRVGDDSVDIGLFGNTQIGAYINGQETARVLAQDSGSLQIADDSGALGNVAAVHKAQTFTQAQTFDETVDLNAGATLANNVALSGTLAGGGALRIARFNTNDDLEIGHDSSVLDVLSLIVNPTSGVINFRQGSVAQAQVTANTAGSLLVKDQTATFKKAGFRNPTVRQLGSSTTFSQTYESQVVVPTVSNQVWTLPQLEAGTMIRIMVPANVSSIRVSPGAGVTVRALLGNAEIVKPGSGQIGVSQASVAEIFYRSSTEVYLFGNALTDFA